MIENGTGYQAQIAEPHSRLSAVTDHLLFDELDEFGVWDIIEAATDVVFAAWKIVSVGVTDAPFQTTLDNRPEVSICDWWTLLRRAFPR